MSFSLPLFSSFNDFSFTARCFSPTIWSAFPLPRFVQHCLSARDTQFGELANYFWSKTWKINSFSPFKAKRRTLWATRALTGKVKSEEKTRERDFSGLLLAVAVAENRQNAFLTDSVLKQTHKRGSRGETRATTTTRWAAGAFNFHTNGACGVDQDRSRFDSIRVEKRRERRLRDRGTGNGDACAVEKGEREWK